MWSGPAPGESRTSTGCGGAPICPAGSGAPPDYQAGMRQAIAAAMSRSNREIPHYYLGTTIDMSRALRWLRERT